MTQYKIAVLTTAALALQDQLAILKQSLLDNKEGIYISHNGEDTIKVYGAIKYKAYIPKIFRGHPVKYTVWNSNSDLVLDADDITR